MRCDSFAKDHDALLWRPPTRATLGRRRLGRARGRLWLADVAGAQLRATSGRGGTPTASVELQDSEVREAVAHGAPAAGAAAEKQEARAVAVQRREAAAAAGLRREGQQALAEGPPGGGTLVGAGRRGRPQIQRRLALGSDQLIELAAWGEVPIVAYDTPDGGQKLATAQVYSSQGRWLRWETAHTVRQVDLLPQHRGQK